MKIAVLIYLGVIEKSKFKHAQEMILKSMLHLWNLAFIWAWTHLKSYLLKKSVVWASSLSLHSNANSRDHFTLKSDIWPEILFCKGSLPCLMKPVKKGKQREEEKEKYIKCAKQSWARPDPKASQVQQKPKRWRPSFQKLFAHLWHHKWPLLIFP